MSRVLLIGSPFFGYAAQIADTFRAKGFEVDFYNDRPSENSLLKGAIRVKPSLVQTVVRRYLDDVLQETARHTYDLIFVINGKAITPWFIRELRRRNSQAQAVLYLWDALGLYPHMLELSGFFDRRYTFDPADARAHQDFQLLPLFYVDGYRDVGRAPAPPPEHDVLNVCTAHENRYKLMRHLVPELEAEGLGVFSYLYLNPLQYAYYRAKSDAFANARRGEFKFRPMASEQYLELVRRSRAILDVNHSSQTGLTMRTLETVGARRKLITTNPEVRNEPFYDPSLILLVDPSTVTARDIKRFIEEPQREIDAEILDRYSIGSWADEILEGTAG